MNYLSTLHQEISRLCPIDGISLGEEIRVDFAPEATQEQQDLVLNSLPELILATIKKVKTRAISEICQATIFGGFTSEALGTPHLYGGEYEEQINLSAMGNAGLDSPFTCTDPVTGIKEPKFHTATQLHQVFLDGATFKVQQIQKYYALKALIHSCTTAEDVEAVTWE